MVVVNVQVVHDRATDAHLAQVAWTQTDPATTIWTDEDELTAPSGGGTPAALLIEVRNAEGKRVSGITVTVVTTVGSISADGTNTCTRVTPAVFKTQTVDDNLATSDALCTFVSFGDGVDEPTTLSLYGTGAETAGKVIITAGDLEPVTISFMLTGPVATVAALPNRLIIGGYADSVTPMSTIIVKARDASDNVVVSTPSAKVTSPATPKVAVAPDGDKILVTADSDTALGEHVIEVTASGKKATVTITVVGPPASVSITAPESIEPLELGEVLVSVSDAAGRPVPAGTSVSIAATGDGTIIGANHVTAGDSGIVEVKVIALDEGQIAIFALVDGFSAYEVVAIGSVVEAAFAPAIAAAGQTFTSYSGGTMAELMAALALTTATSATAALADGSTVTAIVGSPAFVNADFNAAFSSGVPAGTFLAVRSLN